MRKQGIDIPDPEPDGSFSSTEWKYQLKDGSYDEAVEACRDSVGSPSKK